MHKLIQKRRILLICLALALLLAACGSQTSTDSGQRTTLADFDEAVIGILTGSAYDTVAAELFPNAKRLYYSQPADLLISLEQGKIDGFLADRTAYAAMLWEGADLSAIEEPVRQLETAFMLGKGERGQQLLGQINAFLQSAKEDGTLTRLEAKWLGAAEPTEHPDYAGLSGENGALKIAVSAGMKPMSYQAGDRYTGYEVELLTLFAREYGYALEFYAIPFESILSGVVTGKYDLGASSFTVTEERKESVAFSDPHLIDVGIMAVRGEKPTAGSGFESLADLETARLGILTGSIYDSIAKERFPNAERRYFSSHSDMRINLEQGKIDGFFLSTSAYAAMRWEGNVLQAIEEPVAHPETAFIFSKDGSKGALMAQINAFVENCEKDGTLERLKEKWTGGTEPEEHPDYSGLSGENGTLKVAVSASSKPMTYQKGDAFTGYEIELLTLFAREYGYALDFEGFTFDALVPGVVSGKYDLAAAGISITEERSASVAFSRSHMTMDGLVIVKGEGQQGTGFFAGIAESFEKTFIREDRWKLIVEGLAVTLLISLASAALGSVLGFGLYMLSRAKNRAVCKVARGIGSVYSRIIAGTPVLVILMILYYVVFGGFRDISGELVAVICFALTFGSFVYGHMRVSVDSVDRGQTEAAYALGYTRNRTFFRIVFPQAMRIFLPSYCGEIVSLVKATAVVGYIAVNDLTKASDIIRSNTYEAFFPLIAVAVIYFLLTWLVSALLGLVKVRYEPKRRSRKAILKGVREK